MSTGTGTTPDRRAAFLSLLGALRDLADAGGSTPCQRDPDAFTRRDPGPPRLDRRTLRDAARMCSRCPVLDLCATYADAAGERWHVWGGVDRTKRG